ncbi:MAG: beta strand repeat-containing protein, partial [Candidatus Nanohaloarchaea archaeon]
SEFSISNLDAVNDGFSVGGNVNMQGNSLTNIGSATLGWTNLTNYPAGCASDEAVQVVGDTIGCTSLNPGGTVETTGASKGQVAFFIDSENVTGSSNLYWNNSETRLGIGTNTPSSALDVNGGASLSGNLDIGSNNINSINALQGGSGQDIQFNSGNINLRDTSNNNVLRAMDGGNVQIPNGDLSVSGALVDSGSSSKITMSGGGGDNIDLVNANGVTSLEVMANPAVVNIEAGELAGGRNQDFIIHANRGSTESTEGNIKLQTLDSAGDSFVTGLQVTSNGASPNVEIPNGNLQMDNNTITDVGSPSDPYDAVPKQYVDTSDNTISDNQNLQDVLSRGSAGGGQAIRDISALNITDVANFTSSGVSIYQPLSVESSGPLSVSSGIEMTDTSTNTIESYSTMYLQTSSASPTDIVLQPTGQVGIDSDLETTGNVTVGGNLDVSGGTITGLETLNLARIEDGTGDDLIEVGNRIDMNSNTITGLPTPSAGSDAATKNYVDSSDANSDEQVAVDSSASPGYIGAGSGSGVLRTAAPLTYTDNGGNVQIGVQVAKDIVAGSGLTGGANNVLTGADSDVSLSLDSAVAGNQLTYSSGTLAVSEGSGSGLDADTLDGVQLANINWGDVAMAQSDISLADVGAADTNLQMNGYWVSNDGDNEGLYVDTSGNVGVGTNNPQELMDVNGDLRVRGDLDVWGNITNTNVNNLNVNGSILPPQGYDATFDIGSSSRRWRDAYFSGSLTLAGTEFTESNLDALADGTIQDSEAADSLTVGTSGTVQAEAISQEGASSGQALEWDGSNWQPATDNVGDSSQNNEIQTLSEVNGSSSASSFTEHRIDISDTSNDAVIKDYYETDTTNSVNKDLVAGSGLGGGADNVLPGSDSDVAVSINAGPGLGTSSDNTVVNTGTGLTVSSDQVQHSDTSTQSDISQSGGSVVQGIDVDGMGHTTTIRTTDLDNRYYTESTANNTFVEQTGDSMSGNLDVNANIYADNHGFGGTPQIAVAVGDTDTGLHSDTDGRLEFWTNNNERFSLSGELKSQGANLDMSGNSIQNFFASKCGAGKVVEKVNADGSYSCVDIVGEQHDLYVNESGDTLTGDLTMNGNDIRKAGVVNATDLQIMGESTDALYVDDSGDAMSGNLNMQNNDLTNVDQVRVQDAGSSPGQAMVEVGDDAYLTDVDSANTVAVQGQTDSTQATIELGSGGAKVSGSSSGETCIGDQCT